MIVGEDDHRPDAPAPVLPPSPEVLNYRTAQVSLPPAAKRPALGWGLAAAPPLVAIVSWPVLYLIFYVLGFTLGLMVTATCLVWAWWVSGRLAGWCYWRRVAAVMRGGGSEPAPGFRMTLKSILFVAQAVVILSSIPLFGLALRLTQRSGIRLGWW